MDLDTVVRLLDPSPLHLEMGVERLPSGVLHVAARTDMHGCKGKMLPWWFGWLETTQHYLWWHPADHVSSAWENWAPGRHVGATHVVEEKLGEGDVIALKIQFRPLTEFCPQDAFDAALQAGGVSGAVCGRIGVGETVARDAEGRVLGGRLFHIARDTPFGMVLRSHFFLGVDVPETREARLELIPDAMGLGLMKHAYSEFSYLSRFLPSLYIAENRDKEEVPLPWPW